MNGPGRSEERKRLEEKFADGLGAGLRELLADELVCDVMLNADGRVFVERIGEQVRRTDLTIPAARRAAIVKTAVALGGGDHADGASILETSVPGLGWRLEGVLPPVTDAPVLSIRKPARTVFPLESYVRDGRMTAGQRDALVGAVVDRRNILVVGGTGSGKTTLTNALLLEVATHCPEQRVVVLEDRPELQCACDNAVSMVSTRAASLYDLLRASLRMRPDRIIVGEVRGPEARTMLTAFNTGHDGGVCTVHASDARAGLLRLEQLCAQGGSDRTVAREEIAQAIHVVAHIERRNGHRVLREVLAVDGLSDTGTGGYVCRKLA